MRGPTIDTALAALPALDELRALFDRMLGDSTADPAHEWAGSGVLETAGARRVDVDALDASLGTVIEDECAHLNAVYRVVARAVRALADGREADAARALLEAFALEELRDRPERAEAYADAAVRMGEGAGDDALWSLALRRRGRARRTLARFREGERDYARSFEIAHALGDRHGAAEAAIGLGNLLEEEARWYEAEPWYRTALELLESDEDPTPQVWHAWLNLHVVQRARGEIEESVAALETAERVAHAIDDRDAEMFVQNAWGQWHLARGAYDEAERCLRAAVAASSGTRFRVSIRLNLADAILRSGRRLDAAEQARKAERDALAGRVRGQFAEAYRILGRIASEEGNPDAFVLFERALASIDRDGGPEIERARTLDSYARAELAAGDPERGRELEMRAEALYAHLGVHET